MTAEGPTTAVSSSLRIALMPSAYAPAVGGVEVLTARLAHQLQAQGHSVEVWAPKSQDDGLAELENLDGILVRRFIFSMPKAHMPTMLKLGAASLRSMRALRAARREFHPTHLHVQCFSANGVYATALSKLTGTPLIVTLQGETVMDDHDIYDRSTALRAGLRWALAHATHVTGCSQFTLDDSIRRFGLDAAKSSVVFNGVDANETAPEPVELPFDRYVLGLGRVVSKKGFDLLTDAFAEVSADVPDLGLVIAGTGEDLAQLQAKARSAGLQDRIYFPGKLTRGQVASVMSSANMFVMPSRVEPFGIVALEGWRAGVPTIVTKHGGASEFVEDGESGMVVDPYDRVALADAIRRLLTDKDLRARCIAGASEQLPMFAWSRLTTSYVSLYREANHEVIGVVA